MLALTTTIGKRPRGSKCHAKYTVQRDVAGRACGRISIFLYVRPAGNNSIMSLRAPPTRESNGGSVAYTPCDLLHIHIA